MGSRMGSPVPVEFKMSPTRPFSKLEEPFDRVKPSGSVATFSNLSYEVKTKDGVKLIVDDVSVQVGAGQMLAIMGPSGSGKTTLLDLMSFRKKAMDGAQISMNEFDLDPVTMSERSSYVLQDDHHYGVLSVRETISYACRLSHPRLGRAVKASRVNDIVTVLGLDSCSKNKIGTPIQHGVSGGQRRRVTVGCGLVTYPRILFLDEPTTGLDSASAREVMAAIRRIAETERIIVIATIHSSSIETVQLFNQIMILAKGKVAFQGTLEEADARCKEVNYPIPEYHNPADHLLDLVATDFGQDKTEILNKLCDLHKANARRCSPVAADRRQPSATVARKRTFGEQCQIVGVLCERSVVNYFRNLLAYGVRLGMYAGMGLLLATIWVNLGDSDGKISDRLSVHFFSIGFLAFISVAGIPSFLEERSVFMRERKNGMYGPLAFITANTIVTLPFLFACALCYTLIIYFAIGLHPGAGYFFRFLAFLFLGLFVAEAQAHLIAGALPVFIAALALTSFMNGFWMCVQGYFIRARSLPRFWYYSFHFLDYQTFAFETMAKNDLVGEVFKCNSATLPDGTCACVYPPSLETQQKYGPCFVSGEDVIDYLEYGHVSIAGWVGILLALIVVFRLLLYLVLRRRSV